MIATIIIEFDCVYICWRIYIYCKYLLQRYIYINTNGERKEEETLQQIKKYGPLKVYLLTSEYEKFSIYILFFSRIYWVC